MSKLTLFFISLLVSTGLATAYFYFTRPDRPRPAMERLVWVGDRISITSQLEPKDLPRLKGGGFRTIVDIRPDGEAEGQPSSTEIGKAAKESGLGFHYIPVPHESIPDEAVTALENVLAHEAAPTVLYCRTGRRASRLFALAEASRADGPDAPTILEMVRTAGFSAEDLQEAISQRIEHRNDPHPLKK